MDAVRKRFLLPFAGFAIREKVLMPVPTQVSRRDWLTAAASLPVAAALPTVVSAEPAQAAKFSSDPFRYCLNTSTVRGQQLGIVKEIELAAKAGYQGIEPWINELDKYVAEGGSLGDLRKRIADAGLTVDSAIGFAAFLHEDGPERQKGLDEARRAMDLVKQIGGTRIAAPPVGVTDKTGLDLDQLAERFAALVDLGTETGVLPEIELWGFSKTLHRLGEVAYVATQAGRSNALMLLDVYHIFKGGSRFEGLRMLNGRQMECFHVNDYPADPPRDSIKDEHRVFPGDGVAPLDQIFQTLAEIGFRGALSLELFNREYWQRDPLEVARTGLEKTRAAVAKALNL